MRTVTTRKYLLKDPQSVYKEKCFLFLMKFIDAKTIQMDRTLSELDLFVLQFLRILERHTPYVIISGYVSILLGRSRSTEDVDIFIQKISQEQFEQLYADIKKYYWCLNGDTLNELYDYLEEGTALRFAKPNTIIPNFEVKLALSPLQQESFIDTLDVITKQGTFHISSLERQIAFKRYYLKSEKDLEDAQHIEEIFKNNLDMRKVYAYKQRIEKSLS